MDNEIILYQPDNSISLEVRVEDETVWLTQAQIAQLFDRDRSVIEGTSKIYSKRENLKNPWYVQNLHTPRHMGEGKVLRKLKNLHILTLM